jgi:hypothetical protein
VWYNGGERVAERRMVKCENCGHEFEASELESVKLKRSRRIIMVVRYCYCERCRGRVAVECEEKAPRNV